jgi:hypothetical protein
MVCTARIQHNKDDFFLERDHSTWHSSDRGGPVLSLEQIVAFLLST